MRKESLICTDCLEVVKKESRYMMVAIEKPYSNVFFHLECYNKVLNNIGGWDFLPIYLAKNIQVWYNKGVR